MGLDITQFLKDEFLEDYVNRPIIIKGLSENFDIYISVRPVILDEPKED